MKPIAVFFLLLLTACASLQPGYETPTVALSSFTPVQGEGGLPSFKVGLTVINPNREPLNIEGIVYTVSLQGHELIKGVGKDFPVIEGYSEGRIELSANANLLSGIRLLSGLVQEGADGIDYTFEAKIDTGGFFPAIRVEESGRFEGGFAGSEPR